MLDPETKDVVTKLIISVLIGLIIGGEREYRNKSAGLRTIVLICLGSTLFTILSARIGDATGASRVAANIVTGIGFLGAGAIMREGLTVSGLTTASTIWVAAALGMAVGAGEYSMAFAAVIIAFLVLTAFSFLEQRMFKVIDKTLELRLTTEQESENIREIEEKMNTLKLKHSRKKTTRSEDAVTYHYEVIGKEPVLAVFVEFLKKARSVKSYEY